MAVAGCGGGSSNGTTANTLTQTQALEVTADLFAAMAATPLAAGAAPQMKPLQDEVALIRNARLNGLTSSAALSIDSARASGSPETAIPTFTFPCPSGGNIVVAGSYAGTFNATTTNVTENITETPNSCNDNGLIINGSPDIDINAAVNLTGNTFTDLTTISGGFTAAGHNCAMDVTISATVNTATGVESGSVSGSVCGINVSGTL